MFDWMKQFSAAKDFMRFNSEEKPPVQTNRSCPLRFNQSSRKSHRFYYNDCRHCGHTLWFIWYTWSIPWLLQPHMQYNDNYCTICTRNAASLELMVSCSVFTLVSILPFFIFFILLRCPNNLWACSNGGWGLKIMIMVLLVLTIWFLNYGLNAKDSSLW